MQKRKNVDNNYAFFIKIDKNKVSIFSENTCAKMQNNAKSEKKTEKKHVYIYIDIYGLYEKL